jgi:hypothetical protein
MREEIALAAETGRKHRRKPAETAAATATKST